MKHETILRQTEIRRLWRADRPALAAHFARLDGETRRLRFGVVVTDAFIEQYIDRLLNPDPVVWGAYLQDHLRGVGELHKLPGPWPFRGEIALSVEPAWQDSGLGESLFAELVAAAQHRGIGAIHMLCLRENERMQHLARKHDAVLDFHIGDVEAVLSAPWPTPVSLAQEMVGNTKSLFRAVFHLDG